MILATSVVRGGGVTQTCVETVLGVPGGRRRPPPYAGARVVQCTSRNR